MAKDPSERFADASELREALLVCQLGAEPESLEGTPRIPTADFPAVTRPADSGEELEVRPTLQWRADAIRDLAARIVQQGAEMPGSDDSWPSVEEPVDTYVEMPRFVMPVAASPGAPGEDWLESALDGSEDSYEDAPSTVDTAKPEDKGSVRAVARRITPIVAIPAVEAPPVLADRDAGEREAVATEPNLARRDYGKRKLVLILAALIVLTLIAAVVVALLALWR
jgi:hypothetical protein